jgi:hypothetical protein
MGALGFFLGIKAIREDDDLFLSQRHYILDILVHIKINKAKPCITPNAPSQFVIIFAGTSFHDP